jgi:hypothetical protein
MIDIQYVISNKYQIFRTNDQNKFLMRIRNLGKEILIYKKILLTDKILKGRIMCSRFLTSFGPVPTCPS